MSRRTGGQSIERKDDAERVMAVLSKRMGRYGLTLHADKTRLVPFRRPTGTGGRGPASIDLLGFTLYWRRTRRGRWQMGCKTRRARLRRAIQSVTEYCRRHRHDPVQAQHAALTRRLQGHINYFGVNDNLRSLKQLVHATARIWFKSLRRRSQKSRLNWERFNALLHRLPLPSPRIVVQLWGA